MSSPLILEKIQVYAEPEPGVSPIMVRLTLHNPTSSPQTLSLCARIQDGEFLPVLAQVPAQFTQEFSLMGGVLSSKPWELKHSALYSVVLQWGEMSREISVGFRRLKWDRKDIKNNKSRFLTVNGQEVDLESLTKVAYNSETSDHLSLCDERGEGVMLCVSSADFCEALASLFNHPSLLVWHLTETNVAETTRHNLARLDETRPVW